MKDNENQIQNFQYNRFLIYAFYYIIVIVCIQEEFGYERENNKKGWNTREF